MRGLFLGGCWQIVKESVSEGGMTGSHIEETVICTRLGSSSALSFIICCHRSREIATFWFIFTTLPQCSKDMARILAKGTSYPGDITSLWHCWIPTIRAFTIGNSSFENFDLWFPYLMFKTIILLMFSVLSRTEVEESMAVIVSLLKTHLWETIES